MEMDMPEILELKQFDYSDLIKASSSVSESSSLESIIMETLGPTGPGLLAITGVPNVEELTHKLLPLGRKLSLMDDSDRRGILKGLGRVVDSEVWENYAIGNFATYREHGLGTDVPLKKPDRCVSSFAAQLNFGQNLKYKMECENVSPSSERRQDQPLDYDAGNFIEQKDDDSIILQGIKHNDFEQLGDSFKQLGFCMVEVGLLLAQICDRAIDGIELQQTIFDSCTAKGRLIHYHSLQENIVLMNALNVKRAKKKFQERDSRFLSGCPQPSDCMSTRGEKNLNGKGHFSMAGKHATFHKQTNIISNSVATSLWQQWHYDYGIFTLLSAPMFLSSLQLPTSNIENNCSELNQAAQQCSSPDGHTYLKILNDANGKVMFASAPIGSLIVQVGEAAQILSGGKLCATCHCVCRPAERDVSRETFVVFLQPSWNKCLHPPKPLYGQRTATTPTLEDTYATPSPDVILTNELKNNFISLSHPMNGVEPCSKTVRQKSVESSVRDLKSMNLLLEIQKLVPPLISRWKEGQTFAEFSRETTRQYYGAEGVQSKR